MRIKLDFRHRIRNHKPPQDCRMLSMKMFPHHPGTVDVNYALYISEVK